MDLTEPGQLGALDVPNRGVFRAVRTRFSDGGVPTDELAAHLAARATGGAGLVVGPAQMLVHPSASGPSYVDAHGEEAVDGLRGVVDAVHREDARIVGQLTHPGAEESGDWEMQPQLAPSASPSDAAYEMPAAMDDADVVALREGFVDAARNLERAGFDGVELNAGPFSVLRQFLSPRFNERGDEYGGDVGGRCRFPNEALAAVDGAVDGPVGLHLSLAELVYGGYEYGDVPDLLDALSGFDYLSCTVGTRSTYDRTHASVAVEAPELLDPIATAADAVDVPVMGRLPFTDVDDAPRLFDAGCAFVCFTRQLLADEGTLAKLADDERPDRCIRCNQKCLEGVYGHAHGGTVECVVNPRTGREAELPSLADVEPAAIERDVVVVGGGAAGLRFAAIAADRGHDVTLREAEERLGGQLRLAATGPLEPFSRSMEDLVAAVEASTVTVETGEAVTPEDGGTGVVGPEWDAVVVATGAVRPELAEYGFEGETVDAFDVVAGEESVEGDVLLFDDNRWVLTFQVGTTLAEQADDLEIVTRDHYPGFQTEQPNLPGFVAALQARGVTFTGNHDVDAVDADGTVALRNTLTGDEATREPDEFVAIGRRRAEESLYLALDERRDDVYRIGDAVAPRKLDRAYYDGELLARRL